MQRLISFISALVLLAMSASTMAASTTYSIVTFKNGQRIGARAVKAEELRDAASYMIAAFQEQTPSYTTLVSAAKRMTAKDRCFNLYSSRTALASVKAGIVDASANAEEFLTNSIASIEEVNAQTQVTCEMH